MTRLEPGAVMMQPRMRHHRGMQPLTSVQFLGYLKDFLALQFSREAAAVIR